MTLNMSTRDRPLSLVLLIYRDRVFPFNRNPSDRSLVPVWCIDQLDIERLRDFFVIISKANSDIEGTIQTAV